MKNRVIKNHINWSKKRISFLLTSICFIILGAMAWMLDKTLSQVQYQDPAAIIQKAPKFTRTCYFMHILFLGSDKNGKEIEVIQTPMECPSEYKPRKPVK